MIEISFNTTIYELTEKHPDIIEIMHQIGFVDITHPVVRNTAGRVMTLEKGIQMRKKNRIEIIEYFRKHNFELKE